MGEPSDTPSNIEVEWQLDALDLRLVGRFFAASASAGEGTLLPSLPELTAKPARGQRLSDVYVDTPDWRLARSGHVLRVRQRAGRFEATLKDRAPSNNGLRRRLEVTQPLTGEDITGLDPSGPTGRRVRSLVGTRALVQVLEVRTRRNTYSLDLHGAEVGEVALDDTTIVVGSDRHRLRMHRVEVEVLPDWVESLAPLVERLRLECGLQPATLSKFEAGLLAAGVSIPKAKSLGSTAVTADSTIAAFAFAVLRKDAATMLAREPGTRLGDDPENLHQMRVATRRMRAALSLFAEFLPARAARVRDEIGWLAGVLGTVRDLDIQLEKLEGWIEDMSGEHQQALDELSDLLHRHHDEARTRLLEALDSRRYERLVSALTGMLDVGPTRRLGPGQQPALVVLPDLIGSRHRSVVKAARRAHSSGVVTDFHALRIRCKRLRYAIEFTGDLYHSDVKRYSKEIAGLQDALGLIQDAETAAHRMQDIALGAESEELPRSTIFAMGIIAERCAAEASARLAKLPNVGKLVNHQSWRRVAAMLEHRRRQVVEESEARALASQMDASPADPTATSTAGAGRAAGGVIAASAASSAASSGAAAAAAAEAGAARKARGRARSALPVAPRVVPGTSLPEALVEAQSATRPAPITPIRRRSAPA